MKMPNDLFNSTASTEVFEILFEGGVITRAIDHAA